MKTLIAVPCMETVDARFAQCLAALRKVGECTVAFEIGSLVYNARNHFCEKAIKEEFDFILWLDSDMVFSPDLLERLMTDIEGRDMVCGLYYRRQPPYTPVAFKRLGTEDGKFVFEDLDDHPGEIFEVAGCGFGCVLMRTDFLFEQAGGWFTPTENAGEDCAFCVRFREAGYKIYCDPLIPLGHVGTVVVTERLYKMTKEA